VANVTGISRAKRIWWMPSLGERHAQYLVRHQELAEDEEDDEEAGNRVTAIRPTMPAASPHAIITMP